MNKIICILVLFLLLVDNQAQTRRQLETKRSKAKQELAYTKNILNQTSAQKNATLHKLNTINVVIQQRNNLIGTIKSDIQLTDSLIIKKNANYLSLHDQFLLEKKRFKTVVNRAFKLRKSNRMLMFVFSANSLKSIGKRLRFLKKLGIYKSAAIEKLRDKRMAENESLSELKQSQNERLGLLTESEQEKNALVSEQNNKVKIVNELAGKEKDLRRKLREQEQSIQRLNASISGMIANEIAAARRRSIAASPPPRKTNSGSPRGSGSKPNAQTPRTASTPITLTPEAQKLSNSFAGSRGSLPWPVDRGYISQGFGVYAHPDLPGITMVNNGVDIATNPGNAVRCVFAGKVSAVLSVPGQGKAILVNHGEYYTVYSRLENVYVSVGMELSARQNIGTVMTDEEGKTVLNFQVWQGQSKQNPAGWLAAH